ncbi:CDP-alcohol phosphatidyltransferase family protein, partial [Streptomyces sp. DvalAA-14]|uniref:CDP-alcohol phosphatidyltransferase family protein n=1 Tax=Streptomyces sp. DvalAA-14 TaxID=1839759 RepID=UPI001F1F65C6
MTGAATPAPASPPPSTPSAAPSPAPGPATAPAAAGPAPVIGTVPAPLTGRASVAPSVPPPGPAAGTDHLGDPPAPKARLMNVANLLTMIRLALVPGFVLLLVHADGHDPVWRSFAWAAFAVAMITDLFDGELARRYGLVTDFGKIADPIADKAIMGAALAGLSALGDLPWWVTGVI